MDISNKRHLPNIACRIGASPLMPLHFRQGLSADYCLIFRHDDDMSIFLIFLQDDDAAF